MRQAAKDCLELINSKPKSSRSKGGGAFSAFGELDDEGVKLVQQWGGPYSHWALQCSDILDRPITSFSDFPVLSEEKRSRLSEALDSPEAMEGLGGLGVVMWAPQNGALLGRLLSNFARYVKNPAVDDPWTLTLVAPIPVPYGCADWEAIRDLWRHPLLGKQWESILVSCTFIDNPVRMIAPTEQNPMAAAKHIMVAQLHRPCNDVSYRTVSPSVPERIGTAGRGFFVDVPAGLATKTRFVVAKKCQGVIWYTFPQERSPASTEAFPRVRLHFVFAAGSISEFDARGLVGSIRRALGEVQAWFAEDSIFRDPSAMLLEYSSLDAIVLVEGLCRDLAVVAPGLCTIRTDIAKEVWTGRLEDIYLANPSISIKGVKWRRSMHGGRSWASPPTTRAHLEALGRVERQEEAEVCEVSARVSINGGVSGEVLWLLIKLIDNLGIVALDEQESEAGVQAGQWKAIYNGAAGDWTGAVVLFGLNADQLEELQAQLQKKTITLGVGNLTITVAHDQGMAKEAKHGAARRGARRPRPVFQ